MMKETKEETADESATWAETCDDCGHVFLAFHPMWAEEGENAPPGAYVPKTCSIPEDEEQWDEWKCPKCGHEWSY